MPELCLTHVCLTHVCMTHVCLIRSCMADCHIKVILVTMNPMSALSKMVDHVIVLPFIGHTYSGYMLDDAVTFFMFIELLVEDIHKKWDEMTAITHYSWRPPQPERSAAGVGQHNPAAP